MTETDHLQLQTASKAVAAFLRGQIVRGDIPPGSRLRQTDIAKRLGVSTTPVREALASLQAERLVQIDSHRGAVVFAPTEDDMAQCFAIRRVLEPLAAGEAVPRVDEARLARLAELIVAMRAATDIFDWVELNDAFHMTLYAGSGNDRLLEIIDGLRKTSHFYASTYIANGLSRPTADDEHEEILEACRAQDVDHVRALVERHVDRGRQGAVGRLRNGAVAAVSS